MKKNILFLLFLNISVACYAINLSPSPTIIYTASSTINVVVSLHSTFNVFVPLTIKTETQTLFDNVQYGGGNSVYPISLVSGENLYVYGDAGITCQLFQQDGVTPIVMISDNTSPAFQSLMDRRQSKADNFFRYLHSIAPSAGYDTVVALLSTPYAAFKIGNLGLIGWVNGTNTMWGNYTLTGFQKKSYFSVADRIRLLQILN